MPDVTLTIKAKNLSKQALADLKRDVDSTAKSFHDAEVAVDDFSEGGGDAIDQLRQDIREAKGDFGSLAVAAGAISAAFGLMIKGALDASVRMDSLKRGLVSVAGSAEAMEAQLVRLAEVAKLPGLGMEEAIQGSINLQAVGFQAEFAERTLKAVGNALATVGKGRAELEGVMVAMTQMRAKGKILSEEISQMAERMPQIRKAMEGAFGTANVELIQKMGLSVEDFLEGVIGSLEKLPSVSGGVANTMENLADSVEALKVQFGDILLPAMVKVTEQLGNLVAWMSNLTDTQKELIAWGSVTVAALSGIIASMAGLAMAIPHVINAFKALKTAMLFMSSTVIPQLGASLVWLVTNPVGIAITALTLLVAGLVAWKVESDKARVTADKFAESMRKLGDETKEAASVSELITKINTLRDKTHRTTEETNELKKAQQDLIDIAPMLIEGFDNEGNALVAGREKLEGYNEELREHVRLQKEIALERAKERLPELDKQINEQLKALKSTEEIWRRSQEKGISPDKLLGMQFGGFRTRDDLREFLEKQNERVKALRDERKKLASLIKEAEAPEVFGPPTPKEKKPDFIGDLGKKDKAVISFEDERTKQIQENLKLQASLIEDELKKEKQLRLRAYQSEVLQIGEKYGKLKQAANLNADEIAELEELQNERLHLARRKYLQDVGSIEEKFRQKKREQASKDLKQERAIAQALRDANEKDKVQAIEIAQEIARTRISHISNQYNRERAMATFEYNQKVSEIRKELEEYDISADKRLMLEQQLATEKEAIIFRLAEIQKKEADEQKKRTDEQKKRIEDLAEAELAAQRAAQAEYEKNAKKRQHDREKTKNEIEKARVQFMKDYNTWLEFIGDKPGYMSPLDVSTDERRIDIARQISEGIAAIPFDFASAMKKRYMLAKEAEGELRDLRAETAAAIQDIQDDELMSVREKTQRIKEIERDAARERKKIEGDLANAKKRIFQDVVMDFLKGTSRMIEAELQRRLAMKVTQELFGGTGEGKSVASGAVKEGIISKIGGWLSSAFGGGSSATTGTAGASAGGTLSSAGSAASSALSVLGPLAVAAGIGYTAYEGFKEPAKDVWGSIKGFLGFDVPKHDFMAMKAGRAALRSTSFDNPMNDFQARQQGAVAAAKKLGEKSAKDLVMYHQQGFIEAQKAEGQMSNVGKIPPIHVDVNLTVEPIATDKFVTVIERKKSILVRQGRVSA